MKRSDGRSTSKLARALGLLVVLGLPLAIVSPLDPGVTSNRSQTAATLSADAPSASADADTGATEPLEGYAAATPRPTSSDAAEAAVEVRHSSPASGATPVTTIKNDPRCGPGFTSTAITGQAGFACFHTVNDPLPPISVNQAQAASAAPVCLGNGVNGPRIQLVYIYVEGQPDRSSVMVPRITNEIVPRMEGTYRETSKAQGREIGLRLHMPDCKLAVTTLEISEANGEPTDPGTMLSRVAELIQEKGLVTTDRKFLVWLDAGNKGACGIAGTTVPLVANGTDNAVAGNAANLGFQASPALPLETALIFRYGTPVLGEVPHQPECWGRGGTGARTEIHELTHSLGAVGSAAPNSNGFGHCTDDLDIMCYGERGVSTVPRCAVQVELLDCGADDYFNARPNAGSYLSTHWNTANSRFLGDAVVHDAVPLEIPRP